MDPTVTLIAMLEASDNRDYDGAAYYATSLRDWLNKGGHLIDYSKLTDRQKLLLIKSATYAFS